MEEYTRKQIEHFLNEHFAEGREEAYALALANYRSCFNGKRTPTNSKEWRGFVREALSNLMSGEFEPLVAEANYRHIYSVSNPPRVIGFEHGNPPMTYTISGICMECGEVVKFSGNGRMADEVTAALRGGKEYVMNVPCEGCNTYSNVKVCEERR